MVTGLHKYTQYSFQVRAYTGTKYGPLSNAMETRTRQDGKRYTNIDFNLTKILALVVN
jgi:hypothetical protein